MKGPDDRVLWEMEYRRRGRIWRGLAKYPFDVPEGGSVLELGCGSGKTMSSLPRGCIVVGLDFASSALKVCGELRRGERLVQADVRRLPFREGSFDGVVMAHLLGHLDCDGRREVISEVRKVLKPGGVVHLIDYSRHDLRYGRGREVEEGSFRGGGGFLTHFFTVEELRELLKGFNELRIMERVERDRYGGEEVRRGRIISSCRLAGAASR